MCLQTNEGDTIDWRGITRENSHMNCYLRIEDTYVLQRLKLKAEAPRSEIWTGKIGDHYEFDGLDAEIGLSITLSERDLEEKVQTGELKIFLAIAHKADHGCDAMALFIILRPVIEIAEGEKR